MNPAASPPNDSRDNSAFRLRRSCEACRSSKGRCVPSPSNPKLCQRCHKDGRECVFLSAKPRPKKIRSSRMRVAEMEEKLDGLVALLTTSTEPGQDAASMPSPPEPPRTVYEFPDFASPLPVEALTVAGHCLATMRPFESMPLFSFPPVSDDGPKDPISKGLVSFERAEEYLQSFRTKSSFLPFVIIPAHMTVDVLRREKPFLFLAILLIGVHNDDDLSRLINNEFKESMSLRLIKNCEKSIDLLQGILVHLCWYHLYFDPQSQQIYRLCQVAISMAVELGITRRVNQPKRTGPNQKAPKMCAEEIEAKRLLLGTYCLTSSICQLLRKPHNFATTDYIVECSESLAQLHEVETDRLLPHLVRMYKLVEELHTTFDYDGTKELPELDAVRTELLINAFLQKLDRLQSTIPLDAWDNVSITMTFYNLRVYINEIGFHASEPSEEDLQSVISIRNSWYYSPSRNETLTRCHDAVVDCLERFIGLSAFAMANISVMELIKLIYSLFVLETFATGCDAPHLDTTLMCKSSKLVYYLDTLISKFQDIVKFAGNRIDTSCPELMSQMLLQCKLWHTKFFLNGPPGMRPKCKPWPHHSFVRVLSGAFDRCLNMHEAYSLPTSKPVEEPIIDFSNAEWEMAEMMKGWGNSIDPQNLLFDEMLE